MIKILNYVFFIIVATLLFTGCVQRTATAAKDAPPQQIVIDKNEFLALAKVRTETRDSALAAARYISPTIHPGDQLIVNIYEKLPVSQEKRIEMKRVSEDGNVLLPPLGIIHLGGLSVSEAAKRIEEGLSGIIVSPYCEVEITQKGYQPRYYVFGEVGKSGSFDLMPGDRLMDALSAANGCNSNAYRRSIKLLRVYDQKVGMMSINLLDIMSSGNIAENYELQDQDIIFVPRRALTNFNEVAGILGTIVPWYLFISSFF